MELREASVVLREWRRSDCDALVVACQDPEITRWLPFVPRPYTREDAETYLDACIESGPERIPFAIEDAQTGALVGSIDLRLNKHRYRGNVGYWVARDDRGRGVCTAALRAVARHGLDELSLARMELTTDTDNIASQRVAEKVGFQREGVLRAHLRHPEGRVRDSVMFSLLPGELRE